MCSPIALSSVAISGVSGARSRSVFQNIISKTLNAYPVRLATSFLTSRAGLVCCGAALIVSATAFVVFDHSRQKAKERSSARKLPSPLIKMNTKPSPNVDDFGQMVRDGALQACQDPVGSAVGMGKDAVNAMTGF